MANGNGEKNSFWGLPQTVKLLIGIIAILVTSFFAVLGRQTVSGDVQALEIRVETQSVEFRNLNEDVREIKEDIKTMNKDNKEQNRMMQEIHREILRGH